MKEKEISCVERAGMSILNGSWVIYSREFSIRRGNLSVKSR